jgi:hypothetical protein
MMPITTTITSSPPEEGLDFILSHFQEPIFPRTISTHTTGGKQVLVYSKAEALARFRQSNFLN